MFSRVQITIMADRLNKRSGPGPSLPSLVPCGNLLRGAHPCLFQRKACDSICNRGRDFAPPGHRLARVHALKHIRADKGFYFNQAMSQFDDANPSEPPAVEKAQNSNFHTNPNSSSAPAAYSSSGARLTSRSCVTCRRRKVRCNKEEPCSHCTRAGIECVFPGPGRAPRKSRKPPEAELLARLRRLEGVVQSLAVSTEDTGERPSLAQLERPSQGGGDDVYMGRPEERNSIDTHLGRLVINEDRSRYVSNSFWTSMGDEVGSDALCVLTVHVSERPNPTFVDLGGSNLRLCHDLIDSFTDC